jgi:hypothetical protein
LVFFLAEKSLFSVDFKTVLRVGWFSQKYASIKEQASKSRLEVLQVGGENWRVAFHVVSMGC